MAAHVRPSALRVILFDGRCALCHGFVRFVLRHDRRGACRFAPLRSEAGRRLRQRHGLPPEADETVVVIADGQALTRSDAVLAVFAVLPPPWRALRRLAVVPHGLRDAVYRAVARLRFRLHRRLDACPAPPPEMRDRFLD